MNALLRLAVLLIGLVFLAGCASQAKKPPAIALDEPVFVPVELQLPIAAEPVAVPAPPPPPPPVILPVPAQTRPLPKPPVPGAKPADVQQGVTKAIDEARVVPTREGFINATQVWPYVEGALYQVYASPSRVTLIALQAGEQLVTVAAGDTVRWIVGDTISGGGSEQRVSVLVKPTRADLQTNLVITTDRRTYMVELNSTEQTWMASVS